jgi:hypothetical protein
LLSVDGHLSVIQERNHEIGSRESDVVRLDFGLFRAEFGLWRSGAESEELSFLALRLHGFSVSWFFYLLGIKVLSNQEIGDFEGEIR